MSDSFNTILKGPLQESWLRYRRCLKRCRLLTTETAVHDLRVALRRLDAVLDTISLFVPRKIVKKPRRKTKSLRSRLGPLRDVQVQAAAVAEIVSTYPALMKFYRSLGKNEARLSVKTQGSLKAKRAAVDNALRQTVTRLDPAIKLFTGVEVENTLLTAIDRSYRDVIRFARSVDVQDVESLHRLRVVFKRFRYKIEVAKSLLPIPEENLGRMQAFQTLLGEANDADNLFNALEGWRTKQKKSVQQQTMPAYDFVVERRRVALEKIAAGLQEISSFWHATARTKRVPTPRAVRHNRFHSSRRSH